MQSSWDVTLKDLVKRSTLPEDFVVSSVPIVRYYNIAQQFFLEGQNSTSAERRFVCLMRMVSLVIEHIPKHPDHSKYRKWYQLAQQRCVLCMEELEELKLEMRASSLGLSIGRLSIGHSPLSISTHDDDDTVISSVDNMMINNEGAGAGGAGGHATTTTGGGMILQKQPQQQNGVILSQQQQQPQQQQHGVMQQQPQLQQQQPQHGVILSPPSYSSLVSTSTNTMKMITQPPSTLTSQSSSSTPQSSSSYLRSVYIPHDCFYRFSQHVHMDTCQRREQCGVLCGVITGRGLEITHLILPPQVGHEDRVETLDEVVLVEEMMSRQLMQMGWIHTHPTQECFMSSVDLHTQAAYQQQMDEAVAVVVAPTSKRMQVGIFQLSPSGLKEVLKCTLKGFHPHQQQDLYRHSPVRLDPNKSISILDLRNAKSSFL